MRILYYNHAPQVSGAERSLLSIMTGMQAAGHTVALVAPSGELTRAAGGAGIAVMAAPPLVLTYARHPLVLLFYLAQSVGPVLALAVALRRFRPHILHTNSVRGGLIAGVALRLVRPRPRLVVHVRDRLQGHMLGRVAAAVVSREAQVLLAISHHVAGAFPEGTAKLRVLHNAIDLDLYERGRAAGAALRAGAGIPAAAPLVAVVGQLTPWKGQLEALEAGALLRATRPEVHLLLAGAAKFVGKHRRYDTLAYREALVARASKDDLRGAVHLVGEVADVAAVYAAATVLVVPSWAEPFGRVVIEAMAAGCPVVATRAGGIPEIITHGVDGWLVPPRDPAALAAALQQLLDDKELRARLAGEGRATVSARFALPDYTAALEVLLAALLRERTGMHQGS